MLLYHTYMLLYFQEVCLSLKFWDKSLSLEKKSVIRFFRAPSLYLGFVQS